MKKILLPVIVAVLIVSGRISRLNSDENSRLNVVTTTATLKSIAEDIGGTAVDVNCLCQPDQDPHFLQARPVFITWARKADCG